MAWNIIFYETVRGEKPVEEFIKSLDTRAQDKVARTLDHLEEFGLKLGPPHVKKVASTSLWELRILGGDSIRVFYILASQKTFLILHGFKKKKQKTPKKEIKIAENRLAEFLDKSK